MPRARRSLDLRDIDAIGTHHIVAVRRRRHGEITQVKHIALGWMPVDQYWVLQKMHDLELPRLAQKFVEGGYRMKAALFNLDITIAAQIGASGIATEIPVFVLVIAAAYALAVIETEPWRKWLALLSPWLPFGEAWLVINGVLKFPDVTKAIGEAITEPGRKLEEIVAGGPDCNDLWQEFRVTRDITEAQAIWDDAAAQGCLWTASLGRPKIPGTP